MAAVLALATLAALVTGVAAAPSPRPFPAGQSPATARIAGRVLDHDGSPVAGATVVLMHRPIPAVLGAGAPDRRRLVTDDRGVFTGELLAGREYSVWARWATGATAVAEAVADGGFVELRAAPGTGPRRVPVDGLAAWRAHGPLSFRAVVGSANLDLVPVTLEDDVLALPSLPPFDVRTIEVLDAGREVLWAASPDTGGRLTVPPPASVRVRVVGRDGAPLAGAVVRRHLRNYWYTDSASVPFGLRFRNLWPELGVTDDTGTLTAQLPMAARTERDLWLMASRPGHGAHHNEGFAVGPDGVVVARIALAGGDGTELALSLGGRPYAGPLATTWRVRRGGVGTPFSPPPARFTAGRAVLDGLPPGAVLEQAWVVVPDDVRDSLRAQVGAAPPRALRLPDAEAVLHGGPDPLDPESCRAVGVIATTGAPAAAARVVAATQERPGRYRERWLTRADRNGRALLPALDPPPTLVVATTPAGWAAAAPTPNEATRLELHLRPRPVLTGRVRDPAGAPVAGAEVTVSAEPAGSAAAPPAGLPAWLAGRLLSYEGVQHADAQGRFRRALLPMRGVVRLRARHPGLPRPTAELGLDCEPGQQLEDVELQIAVPDHGLPGHDR